MVVSTAGNLTKRRIHDRPPPKSVSASNQHGFKAINQRNGERNNAFPRWSALVRRAKFISVQPITKVSVFFPAMKAGYLATTPVSQAVDTQWQGADISYVCKAIPSARNPPHVLHPATARVIGLRCATGRPPKAVGAECSRSGILCTRRPRGAAGKA